MIHRIRTLAARVRIVALEQDVFSEGSRHFQITNLLVINGSTQHRILCRQTQRDLEAALHKARYADQVTRTQT